eukprot:7787928-Alexandrium_andersonii.AAC.1
MCIRDRCWGILGPRPVAGWRGACARRAAWPAAQVAAPVSSAAPSVGLACGTGVRLCPPARPAARGAPRLRLCVSALW